MDNRNKTYVKKQNDRKLKKFFEYNVCNFSWVASFIIALVFICAQVLNCPSHMALMDYMRASPALLILSILFGAAGLLALIISLQMKKNIFLENDIKASTRRLGFFLIPFMLTGNVFAAIAGFNVLVKHKTIEYSLAVLAFLNTFYIIFISLLNLFKETVANTFYIGIGILSFLLLIYVGEMFLVVQAEKGKIPYKNLKIPAILVLLTGISGNIFALILGFLILSKIKNANESRNVEWVDILRRTFRNYPSILGIFFVSLLSSLAICSLLTFDYVIATENNYMTILQFPSLMYPFGTDEFGRCVLTRIIFGSRISLIIGVAVTAVPIFIGGFLGAISGHYSGKIDNIIMRGLDILYAVPSILLAIAIIAAFGASTLNLIIALSVSMIPIYARTMRAQVMVVTSSEFVEAARACGLSEGKIILKHIIPNSISPIIVRATLSIGSAVLSTSSLSFLGLGVEPHIPEWGSILRSGSEKLEQYPHLAIYPGIAIVLIVLSFNYFGDGLRDALDPKLK